MRNLTLISAFATLATVSPAAAQWQTSGFDARCVENATHILVVNPQGRVLEVWKGDARPGEMIPIYTLANLTLTQSLRANGSLFYEPASHLSFHSWSGAAGARMILFLNKSDAPDPTNGLLGGWRPASETGFDNSVAVVREFGVSAVYVQPRPLFGFGSGVSHGGFSGSEEGFKEQMQWVMKLPK